MTLGTRLAALRKARGLTQEQLAETLNVSRQAISKWESDLAYPETEKLIRISELYNCSLDSLIRGELPQDDAQPSAPKGDLRAILRELFRDRKSKRTLFGKPLWHFGLHARGILAVGPDACGVISIGLLARGVFPIGLLALGLFPIGVLAAGLSAYGVIALGLLAIGTISAGIISAGCISFGILSFGAIAIGDFSIGALAIGRYAALGDHARAMVAWGQSEVHGSLMAAQGVLSAQQADAMRLCLDENVPFVLSWAKSVFKLFLI